MPIKDERSLEQVYRSAVAGLYARLRSNYDYIYRKLGDQGLDMIAAMSREYGLSVAERAKKNLENNDLQSVSGYLVRIFETVNWDKRNLIQIDTANEGRIIIRVRECPLHFENPALCRAHTTMERTVVEELNPKLLYRIGKSIPAGDDFCEHIIELPAKPARGRHTARATGR